MSINAKILTKEKVIEVPQASPPISDYKTKLYSFFMNTPQTLIEMAIALKEKIKTSITLKENVTQLDHDSQAPTLQKSSAILTRLRPNALKEAVATRQYLHLEQSQTFISSFQAILLTLDEDNRLSLLSKDLIRAVSVLGRGSIPEELLKQFFQSLYPDHSLTDFRDALESLLKLKVIQCSSSTLSDLVCYEINYQLQAALDQKFCDERQKEICTHVWERTKFQLDELVKDQGRHKKGFHLYLDHTISFLRKESFKLLLKGPQRDNILLLLDQLFEKEGFYERALPLLTQHPSHALTIESSYAHIQ